MTKKEKIHYNNLIKQNSFKASKEKFLPPEIIFENINILNLRLVKENNFIIKSKEFSDLNLLLELRKEEN